ncbi:conserved phage C-terminal domain-containing protein [Vibrio phage vB_VpP_1]|nr:conserved phage C-terminal domain-containing protein [Vibrio phage vB_VpP_1]
MKWIKHDTDANQDAKLQNVLLDYGLEGYGLYWYCLELIAGKVDKDNITFELEHDARIIARNVGSTAQKVEEMMRYFVKIGLFECSNNVITCLKLARRLDKSMTSNPQMREIIENFKNHDGVMTPSEKPMQDQIRSDQNRIDNKPLSESNSDAVVVLEYLNKVTGQKFKPSTKSHISTINARLKDGATVEDCKAVIDFKFSQWKGTERIQYMRPGTLFIPKNFDGYLLAAKSGVSAKSRSVNTIGTDFSKPDGWN